MADERQMMLRADRITSILLGILVPFGVYYAMFAVKRSWIAVISWLLVMIFVMDYLFICVRSTLNTAPRLRADLDANKIRIINFFEVTGLCLCLSVMADNFWIELLATFIACRACIMAFLYIQTRAMEEETAAANAQAAAAVNADADTANLLGTELV